MEYEYSLDEKIVKSYRLINSLGFAWLNDTFYWA